jgi:SagB-type dehydrogenase family enzyme
MNWREYHEATKHSIESVIRAQQVLDWANMPDPFRHYEGVPVLDLPADPVPPAIPALDVLHGTSGTTSVSDGPAFLSQLFFYSAAISASKLAPSTGEKYALRVNPSSGNLHPTEFHFFTRGLKGWPDGLYHYDPSRHMAEQRGRGEFETEPAGGSAPIVFALTSIVWREAWKYGERAYRYCLHDIGHAWQALALAARAIGCDHFALGHFVDDNVARTVQLNGDEWPMLIVSLHGKCIPVHETDTGKTVWFGGQANQLSKETIAHPLIDSIHLATKRSGGGSSDPSTVESVSARSGGIRLSSPASSTRSFGEVARMRRSALDFLGGKQSMSLAQLSAILASTAQPLYLGDAHAEQGDGELNGNALETSMDVEFSVDVIPGTHLCGRRIETPTHIITMGLSASLDDALKGATDGMAKWLNEDYQLTPSETAQVLGTAAEY